MLLKMKVHQQRVQKKQKKQWAQQQLQAVGVLLLCCVKVGSASAGMGVE